MRSEEEKMLAGELYLAADPALVHARTRAKQLLHRLNVTEYLLTDAARQVLAELVPHAGPNFYVEPPFHCDYGSNIYCGSNVFFNVNCVVLDVAKVTIGSNVLFGPGVQLYAATRSTPWCAARWSWDGPSPSATTAGSGAGPLFAPASASARAASSGPARW